MVENPYRLAAGISTIIFWKYILNTSGLGGGHRQAIGIRYSPWVLYSHGYPRKNLWMWIWTGNFISTASLEILHVFVLLTPPLFHPNFGGSPCCGQPSATARAETLSYSAISAVKLFSKYSNLCGKHTSTSRGDTDGQTDRHAIS